MDSTFGPRMFRVLLLLLFASIALFGQKDTASIVGTAFDSSGAAVPGAAVVATNLDTNFQYHAVTNHSGEYVLSPVQIGRYQVQVQAKGFKTVVNAPFELQVQQRARIDVHLSPGSVQEQVTVTSTVPVLETETSSRGQLISHRDMIGLPLNGRNPVQLAQLTAGVAPSEPGARDAAGYGFSSNGSRSLDNNFLLDGIDDNSNLPDLLNGANYAVMPSVDALQEFRVQTDDYSAEFGRSTGAVVNATLKSGTNRFHGDLYEFLRNDKLDARNFFDVVKPEYRQNQFGATLGGPIRHDRLFFFGDYEGLRIRQGETRTSLVPTAAQRGGDFSSQLDLTSPTGINDCNGHPTYAGELFDTTQTQVSASSPTGFCGVPFGYDGQGNPLNVIPGSHLDPLGSRLAALFPLPNVGGNGYNYVSNPILRRNRDSADVRIDQVFSGSDTAFYSFSSSRQPSVIPSPLPGLADGGGFETGNEMFTAYSAAASETHVFSPTVINEFRLGYNRLHARRFPFNSEQNVSAQIGFPNVPYAAGTHNGGLPQLTFPDVATLGSPTYLPSNEIQNTYILSDTATLILGNSTVKAGGEIRPEEFTIFQPATPRGAIFFGNQFTDNPADPGTGGSGLASMLAGIPGGGGLSNLNNVDYLRHTWAVFVQDDWHATTNLTLNLGLRYEYFSPVMERFNAQANFNPVTGLLDVPASRPSALTPTYASLMQVNPHATDQLIHPDYNNFAPRIGFAYRLNRRTVLRSAYGLFYSGEENGPYSNPSPGFNPPFFIDTAFNAPCGLASANPAAGDCRVPGLTSLQQGFPANALSDPNVPNLFAIDPNLRTPYVQQWNLTLQYETAANTLLEVGYVGSKGSKLYTFMNVNQAAPTNDPATSTAPRRLFPQIDAGISYLNAEGNSEYDALQAKFQHRFSSSFAVLANYTWSHALGNASNANLGAQNNDAFRWWRQPQWEHGNLDFDVRQRVTASYLWNLPIGTGHFIGRGMSPHWNFWLGGWEFSGVTTISDGTWYTVTDAIDPGASSDGQQRPDAVAHQSPNGTPCVPGTWFNTCAYTDAPLGTFGDVGQNNLRGPGVQGWDMSFMKDFHFSESRYFEFRGEFFNVFNHPNFLFAKPGSQNVNNSTVFGTPTFGYVTAAQDPRQVQLGLKFYF